MRPHEALEMQSGLLSAMADPIWESGMDWFLANMDAKQAGGPRLRGVDLAGTELENKFRGQGPMWVETERALLSKATTFIVEERMNPLVRVAAADLPDDFVIEEYMLPSEYGFLVWEEPWAHRDIEGLTMRARAVTWRVGNVANADTGEVTDQRAVIVHEYADMSDMTDDYNVMLRNDLGPDKFRKLVGAYGGLQVQHRFVIVFGMSMSQGLKDVPATWRNSEIQSAVGPIRAMIALWNLMGQQITTTTQAEFSPKNVRRWERKNVTPDVRVINLRRRSLSAQGDHEAHKVDWQGQWRVRGHWHKYRTGPGRQEVRHVYVSDYLKGPEDKPLIEPKKVYRLTR